MSAAGAVLINGLTIARDCVMGLRAEVTALKAKDVDLQNQINAIPHVDPASIVAQAVALAQSILNPQIAAVGVVATGAAAQAGIATVLANAARALALAVGAALATLEGIVAGILIAIAIIGSILFRLSGLENRMGAAEHNINDLIVDVADAKNQAFHALGVGLLAKDRADAAYDFANLAYQRSNEARGKASFAVEQAIKAREEANTAIGKANLAISKSQQAIESAAYANLVALDAIYKADLAIGKANAAIHEVNLLKPKVEQAIQQANNAHSLATWSYVLANTANAKADEALNLATIANIKAILAYDLADSAKQEIAQVRPISETALATAFNAINQSFLNSVAISNTQNQVVIVNTGVNTLDTKTTQEIGIINTKLNTLTNQVTNINSVNTTTTNTVNAIKTQTNNIETKVDGINTTVLGVGAAVVAGITPFLLTPSQVKTAAMEGTCEVAKTGKCLGDKLDDLKNNLGSKADAANQAAQTLLLTKIDAKLGVQIADGLSGAMQRAAKWSGINRILDILNLASNIHNAYMLSGALKVTLLETISSVLNATGLLQDAEGENVDLNALFNKGITEAMNILLGEDNVTGLQTIWKKYNRIYTAATNSLAAVSSMFNSIGNVVQLTAEYTGKIGNSLTRFGVIADNAYGSLNEKVSAKMSKFITFENKVGNTVQTLELINEIAQSVVEGQQAATEFQKANTDFIKALQDTAPSSVTENTPVKDAKKAENDASTAEPTGDENTGLLSFLTE